MDNRISLNLTGIDTDKIIEQLMNIEKVPLQRLQTQRTLQSSRKSAWDAVVSKVKSLTSNLYALTRSDLFGKMVASSSDSSVLTASVTGSAVEGTYDLVVTSLAKSQSVATGAFSSSGDPVGITGSVTLNGKAIDIASTDSLQSIAAKINSTADVNARATVLQTGANEFKMVITSSVSGLSGAMTFGGDTDTWKTLGVMNPDDTLNEVVAASDASFTINGVGFTRSSNSVTDAIPGVTLNLLKAADALSGTGGRTVISVGPDDQAVIDAVKSFVTEYNGLIDTVSKYTTWNPTTRQSGPLFGDPLVNSLLSELRTAVFQRVIGASSSYSSLSSVGISTGSQSAFSRDGKLTLDETKLKTALQTDREAVAVLFGAKTVEENQGIFKRVSDILDKYGSSGGFISLRQAQIASEDKYLSQRIEDMQARLDRRMAALRNRFTQMEVALQKLNSQSAWLSQQLQSFTTE